MAQNSIIELQVINWVVKNKDISILTNANISPSQFSDVYSDIIHYIFKHHKQYNVVPDEETLLSNFGQDYTVIEVSESPRYLIDKLKQFLAFVQFGRDFAKAKKDIEDGKMDVALPFIKQISEDALKIFGDSGIGTDITKDHSRLDEYKKRLDGDVDKMYSLGFDALDDIFGGLLPDDIMLVVARLGHGKSYVLTYFAHILHKQGLNVLFYSGEMEASQVGYRFDSIAGHFSNKALLFGKQMAGASYYEEYMKTLSTSENYFKVVTPADLGGRYLNMNDVNKFVAELKPDVIFIDQLSLMTDVRSNHNTPERTKYSNLTKDLRVIANTHRIPVVIAVQANRTSATKDEDGEAQIPEMHQIAESDAIGQDATRAIAFVTTQIDDTDQRLIKMAVRKNRHGKYGDFKIRVDFEHGKFDEVKNMPLRAGIPSEAGKF